MTSATTASTRSGDLSIGTERLMHMYRQMVSIRLFEERVNDLYTRALMPGLAHLYIGEEAIACGICEALRKDDFITSTHRGHGHCVAKGVKAPPGVPHVCYCYTPMRYAWHMQDAYFRKRGLKAWAIDKLLARLRGWDLDASSAGERHFVVDAGEAIDRFMRDDVPDRDRLVEIAEELDHYRLTTAEGPVPRLTVFGEMASVLGLRGNATAVVEANRWPL